MRSPTVKKGASAFLRRFSRLRYGSVLGERSQKSNLIASCSCLGVTIERGKPKAFAGKADNNVKVLFADQ